MNDLDSWEKIAKAATGGKWCQEAHGLRRAVFPYDGQGAWVACGYGETLTHAQHNAAHIAAANPAAVLELIAAFREQQKISNGLYTEGMKNIDEHAEVVAELRAANEALKARVEVLSRIIDRSHKEKL